MRLDRLTVGGLFTFQQATLAAEELPRGVIAIVGPIGEGKTGLIECAIAALHRKLPTRENELAHYATRRDAFIEAIYQVGDERLRARVAIDPQRRQTAATLDRYELGTWRPLNDGKVSTFAPAVAARFPSFEILLATAFAAQNRAGSFASLSERERKLLFQELLGLGRYEAWSAAAVDVVRFIEKRKLALSTWLRRLEQETAAHLVAAVEEEGNRLQSQLIEAAELKRTTAATFEEKTIAATAAAVALRDVEARIFERGHLQARLSSIAGELAGIERERLTAVDDDAAAARRRQTEHTAAVGSVQRRLAAILTDEQIDAQRDAAQGAVQAAYDADVSDRRERIRNNEDLIARKADIRAAAAELDALETERAERGTAAATIRESLATAETGVDGLRRKVSGLAAWPERLTEWQRTAGLIENLPFGAKCADAKCSFVTLAIQARDAIPGAEQGVRDLETARTELAAAESSAQGIKASLGTVSARLVELDRAIGGHATSKTRDRVAKLDSAEARVAELETELVTLAARRDAGKSTADVERTRQREAAQGARAACLADQRELEERLTADTTARATEFAGRLQRFLERRQQAEGTQQDLQTRLGALDAQAPADAGAQAGHDAAQAAVTAAGLAREEANSKHAALVVWADTAGRRRDELWRKLDERTKAAVAVDQLNRELSEWAFLAAATGRDGLPTLEIDAAGPMVSERANDLIATCYGSPRFTVEIVTQQAKAKGDGLKEVFEMKVWDSKDPRKARDISDLSGGEKILVDEAVKCALALHVNDHNRVALATCFRDETTSAFDVETAMRYMTMLRRVQERGRFEQVFFITHNPAVAAEADAQIHVKDGTLTVRLPPFDAVPANWHQAEAVAQ